jgi:hypothetical protein
MYYNGSNIKNLNQTINNEINSIKLIHKVNNEILNYYYNIDTYFVMPVLIIPNQKTNTELKLIGIKLYIFYLTIFDD